MTLHSVATLAKQNLGREKTDLTSAQAACGLLIKHWYQSGNPTPKPQELYRAGQIGRVHPHFSAAFDLKQMTFEQI